MTSGSPKKMRADELVVARGLAESRTKAQALILAGQIRYRTSPEKEFVIVDKSGHSLPADAQIESTASAQQDVGRGAGKLRGAFETWPELGAHAQDARALDIGASTGGFTQVLLEKGARRVVALDVGTHQLHERLRSDARVLSLEKHHVLRMEAADWEKAGEVPPFDFIVTDVSFISAAKLLAPVAPWLKPGAPWILLVKPQFEVGPKKAPGGIVRNAAYHQEAVESIKLGVAAIPELEWVQVIESPLKGGDGNKEYLAWIRRKNTAE